MISDIVLQDGLRRSDWRLENGDWKSERQTATAKASIKSSISNRQSPLSNHSFPTLAFNSSNQFSTMISLLVMLSSPVPVTAKKKCWSSGVTSYAV